MKKRIISILAVVTLLFSLSGCSMLESAINDIKGNLVGNGYDIYAYDNYGDLVLTTSGDKIRSMNADELATVLCNTCTYNKGEDPMFSIWIDREISMYHSYGDILEWLKQPVED